MYGLNSRLDKAELENITQEITQYVIQEKIKWKIRKQYQDI